MVFDAIVEFLGEHGREDIAIFMSPCNQQELTWEVAETPVVTLNLKMLLGPQVISRVIVLTDEYKVMDEQNFKLLLDSMYKEFDLPV